MAKSFKKLIELPVIELLYVPGIFQGLKKNLIKILFQNSFGFTEKLQEYYRESPHSRYLVFSFITMVNLSQLMNRYWYIVVNYSPQFIWVPLVFTQCLFSVLGFRAGCHITFGHRASLVSQTPLVLMTLTILRSTVQLFCRVSFSLCLSDVLPVVRQGLWVFSWGEDHRAEYHSQSIMSRIHTVSMAHSC